MATTIKKSATKKAAKPAKKATGSTRARAQDRSKVAGGQNYAVSYEGRKSGKSTVAVKKTVKTAGNSRKKVESKLNGK